MDDPCSLPKEMLTAITLLSIMETAPVISEILEFFSWNRCPRSIEYGQQIK